MGANIHVLGTNVIHIERVASITWLIHTVILTVSNWYILIAAAMAGGDVFVENALPDLKTSVAKLKAGVTWGEEIDGIRVISTGKALKC